HGGIGESGGGRRPPLHLRGLPAQDRERHRLPYPRGGNPGGIGNTPLAQSFIEEVAAMVGCYGRGSAPEYDVGRGRDVRGAMRDGVRLATDCSRPARGVDPAPGAFPTLVVRTPYDKSVPDTGRKTGDYFARRGYCVVIQDVRGRYASEGEFAFLT